VKCWEFEVRLVGGEVKKNELLRLRLKSNGRREGNVSTHIALHKKKKGNSLYNNYKNNYNNNDNYNNSNNNKVIKTCVKP